jgi:FlaA1/EpsC-like NDP-sugar epimerase
MLFHLVKSFSPGQKYAGFMVMDALAIALAFWLAHALVAPSVPFGDHATALAALCGAGVLLGRWMGLTRLKLNAYDTRAVGHTGLYAAALGGAHHVLLPDVPPVSGILFALCLAVASVAWRIALREVIQRIYLSGKDAVKVLVYGAGTTGQQLVAALRQDDNIRPVAFIDDNPTLQSRTVAGLRVFAPISVGTLMRERGVQRVVLAMPSLSRADQTRITRRMEQCGCEVQALPSFSDLVNGGLRDMASPAAMQALLGRNRLERELPGVTHAYAGRRILVTGAGGSIGSELCRQILACRPACLILVDHSELALYSIDKELRELEPEFPVIPVLGCVTDATLMEDVMISYGVEVVLHAAAYKHVPMVEVNVLAGLRNNVIGTRVLADAARKAGAERFILVSSDKAVRPTNVMGASKRLAELVVQDLAARSLRQAAANGTGTRFSMVRFGNVLGSSGSVIPLFEEQIARGGPVTLTDPRVTRYFMTTSEAVRLLLLAGSFARGGDVFVLDMGEPVPIARLARQMIEAAGCTLRSPETPDGDIEIRITGLRPGEKLHEELLIAPDMLTTPHPKILRAQESALSEIEVAAALKDLRQAIDTRDEDLAHAIIERWVERHEDDAPDTGQSLPRA